MNTDSFTDEQLLNLVNNTILEKTEFQPEDFTGGAVIVTSTHNNTIKRYRISLYFGYKGNHSINRQINISKDLYFIWAKAILTKVFSMDAINSGMDINELNKLMNNDSNIVDSIKVDSNSNSISKEYGGTTGSTPGGTTGSTTYKQKLFSFSLKRDTHYDNLSAEYKHKLKAKCLLIDGNIERYENFIQSLQSKASYKYKDFSKVYIAWDKEKNYKDYEPIPEPKLGEDWYKVFNGSKVYAINNKTYEIKEGRMK